MQKYKSATQQKSNSSPGWAHKKNPAQVGIQLVQKNRMVLMRRLQFFFQDDVRLVVCDLRGDFSWPLPGAF